MEIQTRELLKKKLVPEYAINLLHLHGVAHVQDLENFGDEDIEHIEKCVRDGSFGKMVDFSSREIRMKYLGIDFLDLTEFSFRFLDMKKLKSIGPALLAEKEKARNQG